MKNMKLWALTGIMTLAFTACEADEKKTIEEGTSHETQIEPTETPVSAFKSADGHDHAHSPEEAEEKAKAEAAAEEAKAKAEEAPIPAFKSADGHDHAHSPEEEEMMKKAKAAAEVQKSEH